MPIPTTAVTWPETMDPSDVLDFKINCASLLDPGETIQTFDVSPGPESALLTLQINTPQLIDSTLSFWISFTNTSDPLFVTGVSLPIEITITTSLGRKWQRTAVVKVAQR